MGCERSSDSDALSDYLLALRGLLDAVDEAGQPTLPRRLAALCARTANRGVLMSRVEAALNLELALIAGVPIDAWSPPPGSRPAESWLARWRSTCAALLRDVVCGYLKPELASMADEILLQSEPVEIEAHDLRADPDLVPAAVQPAAAPADPPPAAHARAAAASNAPAEREPAPEAWAARAPSKCVSSLAAFCSSRPKPSRRSRAWST
jgi:hypothetical protein